MDKKNYVYFDNAATSLNKPNEVNFAVIDAIKNLTANPGRSSHDLSQRVAMKISQTRENLKEFFNAKNYDLIFTKNCTEALNLAIFGTLKNGDHVITTCYEHNSVLRPLEEMKKHGVKVTILDCDLKDFMNEFESKIKANTKLIITTFISNVTGDVCDVKSVSKLCKKHNVKYLIDGAQACGHTLINMSEIDCDFFAFAGHKGLLSLTGVGGLFVKNLETIKPLIYGGTGIDSDNTSQGNDVVECFEAGTISTISIISLGAGINYIKNNFFKILEKERKLCENLYKKLKNIKNLTIFSNILSKNVFSFNIENLDSSSVANILNERFGICVRPGIHCAPLIHKRNKTLDCGAVRVSVDFNNSIEEVDYLIYALEQIVNE